MKRKLVISTLFLLFVLSTNSVLALGSNYGMEKKVEAKSEMFRSNGIKSLVEVIDKAILRLEKITSQIDRRIAKIKDSNSDLNLDKVDADLKISKEMLVDAKADFASLKVKIDSALTSDNPKVELKKLLPEIRDVNKSLKAVHKSLVSLVGDIKGLRVGESKND